MSVTEKTALDPPALRWLQPDAYHIRTACAKHPDCKSPRCAQVPNIRELDCGRYTVSRTNASDVVCYAAWKNGAEIDRVTLPATSTDAKKLEAIRAMQARCYAEEKQKPR